MPSERALTALDDIVANVALAVSFTRDVTLEAFAAD